MNDPFLMATGVRTETSAMSNAIQSALQRNKTYRDGCSDEGRARFRMDLGRLIRGESQRYVLPMPVSDSQHCEAIRRIADVLSQRFATALINGRLRYGTAQKAFNLYLKFLWRLGRSETPPHCPVDSIVLAEAGIDGAWTKCDSENQYLDWIKTLELRAKPLALAEWEYQIWLRGSVK
jgi:hypothetical protein